GTTDLLSDTRFGLTNFPDRGNDDPDDVLAVGHVSDAVAHELLLGFSQRASDDVRHRRELLRVGFPPFVSLTSTHQRWHEKPGEEPDRDRGSHEQTALRGARHGGPS